MYSKIALVILIALTTMISGEKKHGRQKTQTSKAVCPK